MSKPQVNLNVDGIMLVGLVIGVPLVAYIGYKLYSSKEAVVDAINPASDKNLVYSGVNGIGSAFTGDDNFTLGGWAFDWTHNADGSFNTGSIWDVVNFTPIGDLRKINPASDQNVFYKGVNGIGSAITGDKDFTLGGWIYDITH
ncbi:MAG: hypothetical protein AAGC78_10330 [Cellvibrio sp.]|uniref:hypothetical protein n=1 Tax=Cellvibrio sp. TaxID=1965322 RepID=UPI0031A1D7DD